VGGSGTRLAQAVGGLDRVRRFSTTLVVAGPDGAGKSSLASAMIEQVLAPPVVHVHHRPGVLPRSAAAAQAVTAPHKYPPYSAPKSAIKLLYLWVDYQLGWWFRLRPVRRGGGSVIIERGWQDLAVDPLRYRLARVRRLTLILGRLTPRPDLVAVLVADAETLISRADELSAKEITRQAEEWSRWADGRRNVVLLDAAASREETLEAIRRELKSRL
jgi:thymidylate kinase